MAKALTPPLEPQALLHEVPCGIVTFADDGTVRFANETLGAVLNMDAGRLVGSSIEAILTVSSRIFYQTHFFPLLRLHGRAEEVFLTLKASDGRSVPVLANAVRRGEEGEALSHCVVVPVNQRQQYEEEILAARRRAEEALRSNRELIEARKELERHALELDSRISELQRQHRELARLTSVLSHDLREPVRKIGLFTGFLRQEIEAEARPEVDAVLDRLEVARQRTDQLVEVLREYLAVDVDRHPPEEVDLNEALRAADAKLRIEVEPDAYRLSAGDLPAVRGHRRQIVLMFYHLLHNAFKFRRPGVPLQVNVEGIVVQHNRYRASPEHYRYVDYAQILFADNGRGFDMRYGEYVFEMLKQIDPGTPGLGMGLAICRKVAENHEGTISVESEPGVGTRFTVLLLHRDAVGAEPPPEA